MSAGAPSGDDDTGQDFDLNLAPIIDCFTVLITYMLVSAAFIQLDMLNVSVAATSDAPPPPSTQPLEPPMTLSMELKAGHIAALKVGGKETLEIAVLADAGGNWDYAKMTDQLKIVQGKWPAIKDVSVKAEAAIEYKEIVRVLEHMPKDGLKIFLGE